jgi:hypothetical protein
MSVNVWYSTRCKKCINPLSSVIDKTQEGLQQRTCIMCASSFVANEPLKFAHDNIVCYMPSGWLQVNNYQNIPGHQNTKIVLY